MHTQKESPNLKLLVVHPNTYTDARGQYTEIYNNTWVPNLTFIQDDAILSTKGVFRGYHGDYDTWKYVTCLFGKFELSVACIDPQNPMYGREETFVLNGTEKTAILIPPKYVNGHQCLSDVCIFFYKQTTLYRGEKSAYTVQCTDFGKEWSLLPILSQRDKERAKHHTDYIQNGILLKPEEVNS